MIALFRKYPRLLLFGILTAMFSGPGQTFLVSLFIPHMQDHFSLSKTQIAGFYSGATVVSALILPWTGRLLDRMHLFWFTFTAGLLLSAGCLLLSSAQNMIALVLGFFLIRNLGQGTLTMVSSTTMARIFAHMRGKALGLSHLGFPLSEAFFPLIVTFWITQHGWRAGWVLLAGLTALFFVPAVFILLWKNPHEKAVHQISKESAAEDTPVRHEGKQWQIHEILKEWKFYVLLIALLIPPAFFTALFFYQVSFVGWKGWGLEVISAGFIVYGIVRASLSFLIGPAIDRFTARRLFPFSLVPYLFGLICLVLGQNQIWGLVYLGLCGMTMGLAMTMSSALYAELFGTKYLGSIKGMLSSFIVLSTAVSPVILGYLLDRGISPGRILWGMVVCVGFGILMAWVGCSEKVKSEK